MHSLIETKQTCDIHFAPQQSLPNKQKVVVPLVRSTSQEQFCAQTIHALLTIDAQIIGYSSAEPLRQIRMSTCPIANTCEQCSVQDSAPRPNPCARREASSSVKSSSSIRRPMLNGVVRVSRIKSDGVATPNKQKVRRSRSVASVLRL